MIELAKTKEEAHAIAATATRTWGVWLGVGDTSSQRLLAIEYVGTTAKALLLYLISCLLALSLSPDLLLAFSLALIPRIAPQRALWQTVCQDQIESAV